jgi:hypothetical protein
MNNTYNNNHSKLQNNLSCNKILQNILELDEIERKNVYKELIKYCGSNDRKFIKEEIKTYTHKDLISQLPEEISFNILSLLDFKSLVISSMV